MLNLRSTDEADLPIVRVIGILCDSLLSFTLSCGCGFGISRVRGGLLFVATSPAAAAAAAAGSMTSGS